MSKPAKRLTTCKGCGNRIDPQTCHCGDLIEGHGTWAGHSPVPLGCTCGYAKSVKLVARGYSEHVRRRLDPTRPKYSEAIKSIGAFTRGEREFEVLVAHLDAACAEAEDFAR